MWTLGRRLLQRAVKLLGVMLVLVDSFCLVGWVLLIGLLDVIVTREPTFDGCVLVVSYVKSGGVEEVY